MRGLAIPLFVFVLFTSLDAQTQKTYLRISLENTRSHVQTQNVYRFAEAVSSQFPSLQVEVYPEARLFRDRDVLNAVHTGKVEMAVPGTWNLEPYVPDLGLFLLPFLYGRDREENHTLADGGVGKKIQDTLESLYDVCVPGRWMDLGHAQVFTLAKPILRLEDFKGLRIRVPGGKGNELRLFALGSYAVTVPWPELIERLKTRLVDGILSTYETIRSAELWNHGIRYAFEDNQYFPMYIPLVNSRFWKTLTPEQQSRFSQLWNTHVLVEREEAYRAQTEAKNLFIQKGGKVFVPPLSELDRIRKAFQLAQPSISQQMQIDPALVSYAEGELNR